jgi:hypothetical protein
MKNKPKFGDPDICGAVTNPRPEKGSSNPHLRNTSTISPDLDPAGHRADISADETLPQKAIDFAELADGSLVELIEDPENSERTLFAVFKNGRVRFVDRIKDGTRILVPAPRRAAGLADVRLPRGVMNYGSTLKLFAEIFQCIGYVVDIPKDYVAPLAAFVLYTWVADRLPTAVYLSIVGLPQSGKSTLLALLNLLCRRSLLVNDVTQAAAYRVCDKFGATLLIDEIEWNSSHGTGGLRQLLRAGTTRGSRAVNLQQSATSFGPKVFCSLEPSTDPALNSRCLEIPMAETRKRQLLKVSDPRVTKCAARLQKQLLKFRFNCYNSIRPAELPGAEELRPRSQDILSSLAAPLARYDCWGRVLLEVFKQYQDPATRESLAPRQAALVAVLFLVVHRYLSLPSMSIKSITKAANDLLKNGGDRAALSYKATGTLLSALGFRNRERTNQGWILWLDSPTVARIHQLAKTYDNEFLPDTKILGCSICDPAATTNPTFVPAEDYLPQTGERREHGERSAPAPSGSTSGLATASRRVAGG